MNPKTETFQKARSAAEAAKCAPKPKQVNPMGYDTCSYRQQAIAALERMRQPWQVICTSRSVACVLAAVSAGVAVSVVSQSVVQPGLRILTPAEGFAALPEAEVAVLGQDTTRSPVAKALAESIFLALVRD